MLFDLAIGVSPVLDPVYLKYITKNKMVYFILFQTAGRSGPKWFAIRRNSCHALIVLFSRILIVRPIRGDTIREVGFN
jgi:hypothetical protein